MQLACAMVSSATIIRNHLSLKVTSSNPDDDLIARAFPGWNTKHHKLQSHGNLRALGYPLGITANHHKIGMDSIQGHYNVRIHLLRLTH